MSKPFPQGPLGFTNLLLTEEEQSFPTIDAAHKEKLIQNSKGPNSSRTEAQIAVEQKIISRIHKLSEEIEALELELYPNIREIKNRLRELRSTLYEKDLVTYEVEKRILKEEEKIEKDIAKALSEEERELRRGKIAKLKNLQEQLLVAHKHLDHSYNMRKNPPAKRDPKDDETLKKDIRRLFSIYKRRLDNALSAYAESFFQDQEKAEEIDRIQGDALEHLRRDIFDVLVIEASIRSVMSKIEELIESKELEGELREQENIAKALLVELRNVIHESEFSRHLIQWLDLRKKETAQTNRADKALNVETLSSLEQNPEKLEKMRRKSVNLIEKDEEERITLEKELMAFEKGAGRKLQGLEKKFGKLIKTQSLSETLTDFRSASEAALHIHAAIRAPENEAEKEAMKKDLEYFMDHSEFGFHLKKLLKLKQKSEKPGSSPAERLFSRLSSMLSVKNTQGQSSGRN